MSHSYTDIPVEKHLGIVESALGLKGDGAFRYEIHLDANDAR
jgi:hypothetical protein